MPGCLDEAALWQTAVEDRPATASAAHVAHCAACRAVIEILREDVRSLRKLTGCATAGRRDPHGTVGADAQKTDPEWFSGDEHSAADCAWNIDSLPQTIGRYPVDRLIRCSGQAAVYLGRHPDLGIPVVVKWSHRSNPAGAAPDRRLLQEARLLASIRHPYLARVFDVGVAAERTFVVLEHVAGSDLRAVVENRRLPMVEAARLIERIASAVSAMHRQGMLHLDIKPENIVLGDDGEPRLIDLGSACTRQQGGSWGAEGAIHGTPEYMAPEQRVGDGQSVCPATDVYALGAVLLELLTGEPPRIEQLWGTDHARVTELCGAGRRSAHSGLRRICRRAIDPDPQRRFAAGDELSRALRRYLSRWPRRLLLAAAAFSCVGWVLLANRWQADRDDLPRATQLALQVVGTSSERRPEDLSEYTVRAHCRVQVGATASLFIVFPDGTLLPIAPLEWKDDGALRTATGPPADRPLRLSDREQSVMIVAVPGRDPAEDAGSDSVLNWSRTPLPQLPPGMCIRLTAGSGPSAAQSPRRETDGGLHWDHVAVRALQTRLALTFPEFEALLFTPPIDERWTATTHD